MLSDRFYEMVSFGTSIGLNIGAFTISFDKKKHQFYITPDPKCVKRMQNSYSILCLWVFSGFLLYLKYLSENNIERSSLTLFYCFGATAIVFDCFSPTRWFANGMCKQINGTFQLLRYIHQTYMPNFDRNKNRLNWYLDTLVFCTGLCWMGMWIILSLLCFYDPTGIIFLGAWIPEKYYSFFPVGLLISIFHTWYTFVGCVNGAITFGCILIYMFYVTVIFTNELKLGSKPERYRTSGNLRDKSANLIHIYRCFQILNANTMCYIGQFVAFTHALMIIIPVISTFVTIKFWNVISTLGKGPIILGFPLSLEFWTFVLQLGKYMFVRSNKILVSWSRNAWQNNLEEKMMIRFRKSCRPVVICWGKSLVLARITQFNYVKGILRGCFKALLTMK